MYIYIRIHTYTVPQLGQLFEVFMEIGSSYSQHRIWSNQINSMHRNNQDNLNVNTQDQLMNDNGNNFNLLVG